MASWGGDELPFKKWSANFDISGEEMSKEVAKKARDFFLENFDEQQFFDENPEPWEPLAQSTIDWKKAHGYGDTPLVNTRNLRDGIKDSIKVASATEIRLEVDVEYADYHNNGVGVPKREFMGESYELTKLVSEEFDIQIGKIIK